MPPCLLVYLSPTEPQFLELNRCVFILVLDNVDDLVGSHIAEHLCSAGRWPEHFKEQNLARLAQPNCLSQRIRPKAAAAVDVPVDRPFCSAVVDPDVEPGPDRGAVGPSPFELDRDPVVAEAGVLEQRVVVAVLRVPSEDDRSHRPWSH